MSRIPPPLAGPDAAYLPAPKDWIRVLIAEPTVFVYYYPFVRKILVYKRSEEGYITTVDLFTFTDNKWLHRRDDTRLVKWWLRKYPRTVFVHTADGRTESNLLIDYTRTGKKHGSVNVMHPLVDLPSGGYESFRCVRRGKSITSLRVYPNMEYMKPAPDPTPHFTCTSHSSVPLTRFYPCYTPDCNRCGNHGTIGYCQWCDGEGHNCPICLRGALDDGHGGCRLQRHIYLAHGHVKFPVPVEVKWQMSEDRNNGEDSRMEAALPDFITRFSPKTTTAPAL